MSPAKIFIERFRAQFSGKTIAIAWLLSATALVLAPFQGAAATGAAVGALALASSLAATLGWLALLPPQTSRIFLAAGVMAPTLILAHMLAGHAMQPAMIAGSFLVLTLTIGWMCQAAVLAGAATLLSGQVILFLIAPAGVYASGSVSIALVLLAGAQAALLLEMIRSGRRLESFFEKLAARSRASKETKDALADAQETLALRDRERRQQLQKLITSFDTDFLDSFDLVLKNLDEMKDMAGNLTTIANKTNGEIEVAAQASIETSGSIASVAKAVQQLSSSISLINGEISVTSDLARSIGENAHGANKAVDTLDVSLHNIDNIVGLIRSIANKINLLALNARIEAARAGAAGHGFAVVATEVKSLANQTAAATQDVAQQVEDIKSAAARMFEMARELSHGVRDIDQRTLTISESVNQQDSATKVINENVLRVAGTIRNMAAINDNVLRSSTDTLTFAHDVLAATEAIQNRAVNLETSIHQLLQRIATS